jgi:hypothetical protein
MKVLITYEERITRKLEKEVEMTKQQYRSYLKNGADVNLESELCGECGDEHFIENELIGINFTEIK